MKVLYLGIHITRQRFKYYFNQGFCTKSKVQRICSTGDWFRNYGPRSQISIRRTAAQNFIVLKKLLAIMMKWRNLRSLIQFHMVNTIINRIIKKQESLNHFNKEVFLSV